MGETLGKQSYPIMNVYKLRGLLINSRGYQNERPPDCTGGPRYNVPLQPRAVRYIVPGLPRYNVPSRPPGDQSEARKSMKTNHSPPWGAVRVHCTGVAPVQCTLLLGAVRVHCTGAPRYNPGGDRFDSPDCYDRSGIQICF